MANMRPNPSSYQSRPRFGIRSAFAMTSRRICNSSSSISTSRESTAKCPEVMGQISGIVESIGHQPDDVVDLLCRSKDDLYE